MKAILFVCALVLGSVATGWSKESPDFGTQIQQKAVEFLRTLEADQVKATVFSANHGNRWKMRFTGGARPGLQLKSLNQAQRKVMDSLIGMVLSAEGLKRAGVVAAQDGEDIGHLYVAFFGDPRTDANFAWRIGEHHFTIVHTAVAGGKIVEFGPILLGANPYGPWDDEEQNFINVWKACAGKVAVEKGKGIATASLTKGQGTAFPQLPKQAQGALKSAWTHRLKLFTPAVNTQLNSLLERSGGWQSLSLAFYNEEPMKLGRDGGRWDAKLGNGSVLFDVETSRGHNHMSLWFKSKGKE